MTFFLAEHLFAGLGILAGALYVTAAVMAVDAVMRNRTAQGAIAWAVSLITIPLLALPLYIIFGRNRFNGYVAARRSNNRDLKPIMDRLARFGPNFQASMASGRESWRALEMLALMPFTKLSHAVLFPFERVSSDVYWRFPAGAGDRVAEALHGKEPAAL